MDKYDQLREIAEENGTCLESFAISNAPTMVIGLMNIDDVDLMPGGDDFPLDGISEKGLKFLGSLQFLKNSLAEYYNRNSKKD